METQVKNPSKITPAEVRRYACYQALRDADRINFPLFDRRTAWGKEMSRRVKTYLSFHRKEIEEVVRKHQARARKNLKVKFLERQWTENVLSNSIYLDYKKCLSENSFSHLRVRHNMLSVDRRNHMAATPMDYKVLAILKHRKVDNVDEKWY